MKCPRCQKDFYGTPERCPHCHAKFVWVPADEYENYLKSMKEVAKPSPLFEEKKEEVVQSAKPVAPAVKPKEEMSAEERVFALYDAHKGLFNGDLALRFFATFFALCALAALAFLPVVTVDSSLPTGDFSLLKAKDSSVLTYVFAFLSPYVAKLPNPDLWHKILIYVYYATLSVPALGILIVLLVRFFRWVVPSLRRNYIRKHGELALKDKGVYHSRRLGGNIFGCIVACLITPILFSVVFFLLPWKLPEYFDVIATPSMMQIILLSAVCFVLILEPIFTVVARSLRSQIGKLGLKA